jgi:DNA-directed RNA polymerase delta subunit
MPSNNLLNSDISFIEAAKITLKENGNVPMTSKEIWDYIDKNKLKKICCVIC